MANNPDMTDKEDFRQILLDEDDAKKRRNLEDGNIEMRMRKDYEFFIEDGNEHYLAIEALNNLKRKFKMYDWEWDILTLDDALDN